MPPGGGSDHSSLPLPLRNTFTGLAQAGIPYVVLRGYLPLAELARSPDIDVLIPARSRTRAALVLGEHGWMEWRRQTGRYPHHFFGRLDLSDRVATMLDVVHRPMFGDDLHELSPAAPIFETAESLEGVRVPHPWIALFLFALHVVLDKGALSDTNAERGAALWRLCRTRSGDAGVVGRSFGAPALTVTERFATWLEGGRNASVASLRDAALGLPCLDHHRLRARADALRRWVVIRAIRPTRVAMVGLDGSGKSTLSQRARELLVPIPASFAYLGSNQFITPAYRWTLARLKALEDAGRGNSLELRVLDKVRDLIWPLELRARVRRAEWRSLVVFYDRFPFPRFERESPPRSFPDRVVRWYERLWARLLAPPDILVLCDGAPEVIWGRKREFPLDVHLAQRDRYVRLFESFKRERHLLLTDGPVDRAEAQLEEILRLSPTLRRRIFRRPEERGPQPVNATPGWLSHLVHERTGWSPGDGPPAASAAPPGGETMYQLLLALGNASGGIGPWLDTHTAWASPAQAVATIEPRASRPAGELELLARNPDVLAAAEAWAWRRIAIDLTRDYVVGSGAERRVLSALNLAAAVGTSGDGVGRRLAGAGPAPESERR